VERDAVEGFPQASSTFPTGDLQRLTGDGKRDRKLIGDGIGPKLQGSRVAPAGLSAIPLPFRLISAFNATRSISSSRCIRRTPITT
jgi:hypothetical protein